MDSVRIDKWLWAARVFKHRSKASRACAAGHVSIDDVTVKASKSVKRGDRVAVQTEAGRRVLEVVELADKRGPASVAEGLYVDHSPPPPPPDPWMQVERGAGRPTKRDRRQLDRVKKGDW
ncbi:MAG: ribosome-associated heat shock protein Hsp15 [Myxococcota bacterium]|jgi:ribosome-associated heat shock protein Hsp15